MYGSYGSYSSMSGAMAIPMDVTSSNLRAHDATCAFPSWPRRSSLSDSDNSAASRPTSFLSDDDLFFCMSSDPFAEDSSSSEASTSAAASLEAQLDLEREREHRESRERLQREQFVRQAVLDKETQRRRQQQALRRAQLAGHQQQHSQQHHHQSRKSSPKKGQSPKSKLSSMTPIAEV